MSELRVLLDLLDDWERAEELADQACARLRLCGRLEPPELDTIRALQRNAAQKLEAVRQALAEDNDGDRG